MIDLGLNALLEEKREFVQNYGRESGIGLKTWREFGNQGAYWVPSIAWIGTLYSS